MTYLTVPICAKEPGEAVGQIESARRAGAEMLELRTDYLNGLSVELAKSLIEKAKTVGLPVLVTCRDKRQGGARDYPAELRLAREPGTPRSG